MNKKFIPPKVETCEELNNHPNEFKNAVIKLVTKGKNRKKRFNIYF